MKTIYLQRQGSTHSYNTNNSINSQLGFYIGIEPMRNNKYHITIASRCKQKEDTEQSKTIIIEITAPSLSSVFKHIEKEIRESLFEDIIIADTIEMYCYNNFCYEPVEDKYLAVCFYEK